MKDAPWFSTDPNARPETCPVAGCENQAADVGYVVSGDTRMRALVACADCQTVTPVPTKDRRGRETTKPKTTGRTAIYLQPGWDSKANPPVPQQIELVRRRALVKEIVAGLEHDVSRATADKPEEPLLEACKEWVFPDETLETFHVQSPWPCSLARMAATSSLMSMPTGHQVMQRPQPTHPEVPN